jgi:hypothetical protein
VLVILHESFKILNARVHYEMAIGKQAAPTGRGGGVKAPSVQLNREQRSSRRVLEPYRTPHTLVLVLHEEASKDHMYTKSYLLQLILLFSMSNSKSLFI